MKKSRAEIIEILLRELKEMKPELPDIITEETSFQDNCGMDSLALSEYIARMEYAFKVEVPDSEWKSLSTLGLVADYVEKQGR